jgi:hypothetical protein
VPGTVTTTSALEIPAQQATNPNPAKTTICLFIINLRKGVILLTTWLALRLDPNATGVIRQATAGTACGSGFGYGAGCLTSEFNEILY